MLDGCAFLTLSVVKREETAGVLERERHRIIRNLVEDRSVVSVTELVELLVASEATIRRDIAAMADRGELRRVRGGAEALRPRHQAHLEAVHSEKEERVLLP